MARLQAASSTSARTSGISRGLIRQRPRATSCQSTNAEVTISFELWVLVIGALLALMGLTQPIVQRLPITPSIVYLLLGAILGPWAFGVLRIDPLVNTAWLHHGSEIAVVVSLFTVGLKLRLPINDPALRPALWLATVSMTITIGLVAWVGAWLLDLPLGAAVLLGAVLAPTDPVLAADVHVRHPLDRDRLRVTLSVEAGLNDGTAFPFVMLGLGLLGLHDLGAFGGRWAVLDLVWATVAGIAIGAILGYYGARLVLRLIARRRKPFAGGEYLLLGLIGLSYGLAIQARAYGFLAVFAAGVAVRLAERRTSGANEAADAALSAMAEGQPPAANPRDARAAPAYFAGALLATNEQLERILEVALVLVIGAMLVGANWSGPVVLFAALLFVAIRPLAALPLLGLRQLSRFEFGAAAWFGIRGIGSIYYLMFAIDRGIGDALAEQLVSVVVPVLALSVIVHGVSVTPLLGTRDPARASKNSARDRHAGP